ncbi:hypothetical protein KIH74_33770 [Kineosporia sp. J2-2]|uniref:Uncharacterized protein n=1 Tax=Kineosporia corallincola TaxID=2835133 RepID=A0ABS5TT24_9ACTN|nr:hypothetical protein [Kineosporia corallincola]MBT0773962.1 hypothetical protein [Kineosporia corallincola]
MTPGPHDHRAQLLELVDAAQRVAGVIAARDRGDKADAAQLLGTLQADGMLGQGALLLADMLFQLHRERTGDDVQTTLRQLCLQLEASVRAA